MKCFVFDLDGTLANLDHRLHHIREKTPKDWDAFFADTHLDKPILHIHAVLLALRQAGETIIFSSGRPERTRDATVTWLIKYKLHNPLIDGKLWLFMRQDNDRRDDDIIKREILGKMWAEGFEPVLAFDDRDRVVKMWRENGIPCAQVAPGDF